MKTALCYFSATGNTFETACRLQKRLPSCDILPLMYTTSARLSDYDAVGILSPVYNRGLPEIVDKFIKNLILNNKTYYFMIVTYSNQSGKALRYAQKAFKWKTQKLHYTAKIRMPDNRKRPDKNTERTTKRLYHRMNKYTFQLADHILSRKTNTAPRFPFAGIGHENKERKLRTVAQQFVVTGLCDGCGYCESVCPAKNIQMKNNQPVFAENCIGCLSCYFRCPKAALNIGQKPIEQKRYFNPNMKPEMLDVKLLPGK